MVRVIMTTALCQRDNKETGPSGRVGLRSGRGQIAAGMDHEQEGRIRSTDSSKTPSRVAWSRGLRHNPGCLQLSPHHLVYEIWFVQEN